MAMILDEFMERCRSTLLRDAVFQQIGVKSEVQTLLLKMENILILLEDAEQKKFNDSSINFWLSQLKDFMYDADDIIDLCRIEGNQLLADENSENEKVPVCFNFSSTSSYSSSVSLRRGIRKRIKDLNVRLQKIDENRKRFNLQKSEISEEIPQITLVNNPRQTSSLVGPLVVGEEVEVAANELVNLLIGDQVAKKCRIFAVAGMGGLGKTTLAQKIFNHPKLQNYFSLNVWICVSQTYSETELLKQLIIQVNGSYRVANNTTSELQRILTDSVASARSLLLVLDDVWRADVWVKLLRLPLQTANTYIRILVTTRSENVAKAMKATHIHKVMRLSIESSWDMLRKLVFSEGEDQKSNELKELGIDIVERCGGLPLAIKAIAGVLKTRERTKREWGNILRSDPWSIRDLHEHHIAALHLSFEDLPSHLKQCFLYFSLYAEDVYLYPDKFARLWVAEGFVRENIYEGSLMEDVTEKYFNELLGRNLLLLDGTDACKMHVLVRSLVIFLSREETSYGDVNQGSSKLRRLSIQDKAEAIKIFDLVAKQGALRTLLAARSDLLLNEERLKWLSHLRVLDISHTKIKELPGSIGGLVHLRFLDVSSTEILTVPESIEHLSYLQFLDISNCSNLTKLPNGITQLLNLRYLDMRHTHIRFMPKGIEKLQQLNFLDGFQTNNNDISSKLEDLNSLEQIRTLRITNLEGAQCEEIILNILPHLSDLTLSFSDGENVPSDDEQKLAAEKLLHKIIPPQSLKKLLIDNFFGRRLPNWMAQTCFENLNVLWLCKIKSVAKLPPLGQLPQLRELFINGAKKMKKIGPEFLSGVGNSTTSIAFPKLEILDISNMDELEEWSFGAQVQLNVPPRLNILPCLHGLYISYCPLLKQLPKGLKHLPIKLLVISDTNSLNFAEDLPSKGEELRFDHIRHLERICCLPMLKQLSISSCTALSCVENLDSLQKLKFTNTNMKSLPDWLLVFLQQSVLQNEEDFLLELTCHSEVLQACLKGGSYWELIQHIPQVFVRDTFHYKSNYLRYNKHPYAYSVEINDY